MSMIDSIRRDAHDVNQLEEIPHDSPEFLAHAILAADLALRAYRAETIADIYDVQREAIQAILYSPLGISLEIEALYTAISKCCISRAEKKRKDNEYHENSMYAVFRKNPTRYIPKAVIVKRKHLEGSIPDFFLEVDGVFSIAEFKSTNFKKRPLYQLQEYMAMYKAEEGYAVAPTLACALPPGIHFVKMYPVRLKLVEKNP